MRLNLLSFSVLLLSLSLAAPAIADRITENPQVTDFDRLTSLEFQISQLQVDNFNTWFGKSRTLSITIEYCHDLDTGDGRGTCWLLAQSKDWTVTAGPNPSSSNFSMEEATYSPASKRDSRISVNLKTLKNWMETLNPGADLPEYLAVKLVSKGYIVQTPGKRIRIPIVRGSVSAYPEDGFHSLLDPKIGEHSGNEYAKVWFYATYAAPKSDKP